MWSLTQHTKPGVFFACSSCFCLISLTKHFSMYNKSSCCTLQTINENLCNHGKHHCNDTECAWDVPLLLGVPLLRLRTRQPLESLYQGLLSPAATCLGAILPLCRCYQACCYIRSLVSCSAYWVHCRQDELAVGSCSSIRHLRGDSGNGDRRRTYISLSWTTAIGSWLVSWLFGRSSDSMCRPSMFIIIVVCDAASWNWNREHGAWTMT